jgi:hypothetical protein
MEQYKKITTWFLIAMISSPLLFAYPPDPSKWDRFGGGAMMGVFLLVLLLMQMSCVGALIREDVI